MSKQKKKKSSSELLLPIIITIGLIPFISRMLLYDCGLSNFLWFSNDAIVTDFFSYYKGYLFSFISVIAGIILLIYTILYRDTVKSFHVFIPLGIYVVCILLSTIFSIDKHTSLSGGIAHFENLLVLLGYVILCIYAYQMIKSDQDIKLIKTTLLISLCLMCFLGILQMIGLDPFHFEWFQKLIIPSQYHTDYLGTIQRNTKGNAVSLTLFNSNYAGVYLAMLLSFFVPDFIAQWNTSTVTKKPSLRGTLPKVGFFALILIMLILIAKTYSRAALVSVLFTAVLFIYFYRKQIQHFQKPLLTFVAIMIVIFIGVDSFSGFRFMNKISATFTTLSQKGHPNSLEEIVTNKDTITIRYKGKLLNVALDHVDSSVLSFSDATGSNLTSLYNKEKSTLSIKPFHDLYFTTENRNGITYLVVTMQEMKWNFLYKEDMGYLYENDFGKLDKLKPVSRFGFKNHENIASGRGYIWSRSIPLLKNTIFIGSGPDTFPLVFPQSDYVGKANNCKTPYTFIEKPHNLYLMIGIQTGLISLIAFLVFCVSYIIDSMKRYKNCTFTTSNQRIGLGCFLAVSSYLICGIFNDSSLQTSPIFWVLIGMGIAINRMNHENFS